MSDAGVVRRVSSDCVPVAVNLYEIRKEKSRAGDFFRAVQKQRPEQYQGIYVVSPDGTVLSTQPGRKDDDAAWTKDLLDVIDKGVKAYGAVTPRKVAAAEIQPYRGKGVREDKSIDAAVYGRLMLLGYDTRGFSKPFFDRITFTAEEVPHLSVPNAKVGDNWKLPVSVVKKFHRLLSPASDANIMASADEVERANMTAKVLRVKDGVAELLYTAEIAGTHVGRFDPNKGKKSTAAVKIVGVGSANAETGEVRSFTLVGEGKHKAFPPYDEVRDYGVVVEWRRK